MWYLDQIINRTYFSCTSHPSQMKHCMKNPSGSICCAASSVNKNFGHSLQKNADLTCHMFS